jgi:hypothetical protein
MQPVGCPDGNALGNKQERSVDVPKCTCLNVCNFRSVAWNRGMSVAFCMAATRRRASWLRGLGEKGDAEYRPW